MTSGIKNKKSGFEYSIAYITLLLFMCLILLPVILLLKDSVQTLFNIYNGNLDVPLFTTRHVWLLLKSLTFTTFSVALSGIIGFLSASYVFQFKSPLNQKIGFFVTAFAFVPHYVHALIWLKIILWINSFTRRVAIEIPTQGLGLSIVVQSFAWLPLCFAIAWFAFHNIDTELLEESQFIDSKAQPLWQLIWPLSKPILLISWTLLWLVTLLDYTVPSLFSVNVFAMEIFLLFTTHYNHGLALIQGMPLILMAILCCWYVYKHRRVINLNKSTLKNTLIFRLNVDKGTLLLQKTAFIILAINLLSMVYVIGAGFIQLPKMGATLITAAPDFITSSIIVAGTIVLSTLIILGTSLYYDGSKRSIQVVATLSFISLIIPAPLIGIALIRFWNIKEFQIIYSNLWLPIIAMTIRFIPFGLGITFMYNNTLNSDLFDMAALSEANPSRNFLRIKLPLISKGIFLGVGIIGLLSWHEIAATILTLPPGKSTISLRVYNFLHYGATDEVMVLNGIITLGIIVLTLFLQHWLTSKKEVYAYD